MLKRSKKLQPQITRISPVVPHNYWGSVILVGDTEEDSRATVSSYRPRGSDSFSPKINGTLTVISGPALVAIAILTLLSVFVLVSLFSIIEFGESLIGVLGIPFALGLVAVFFLIATGAGSRKPEAVVVVHHRETGGDFAEVRRLLSEIDTVVYNRTKHIELHSLLMKVAERQSATPPTVTSV